MLMHRPRASQTQQQKLAVHAPGVVQQLQFKGDLDRLYQASVSPVNGDIAMNSASTLRVATCRCTDQERVAT